MQGLVYVSRALRPRLRSSCRARRSLSPLFGRGRRRLLAWLLRVRVNHERQRRRATPLCPLRRPVGLRCRVHCLPRSLLAGGHQRGRGATARRRRRHGRSPRATARGPLLLVRFEPGVPSARAPLTILAGFLWKVLREKHVCGVTELSTQKTPKCTLVLTRKGILVLTYCRQRALPLFCVTTARWGPDSCRSHGRVPLATDRALHPRGVPPCRAPLTINAGCV